MVTRHAPPRPQRVGAGRRHARPDDIRARLTDATHYQYGVAFSRDGRLLTASSADGLVRLWRVPAASYVRSRTYDPPCPASGTRRPMLDILLVALRNEARSELRGCGPRPPEWQFRRRSNQTHVLQGRQGHLAYPRAA